MILVSIGSLANLESNWLSNMQVVSRHCLENTRKPSLTPNIHHV